MKAVAANVMKHAQERFTFEAIGDKIDRECQPIMLNPL